MRKKTLAAFAVVYSVLCMTYGTVNGINVRGTEAAEEQLANEGVKAEAQAAEAEAQAAEAEASAVTDADNSRSSGESLYKNKRGRHGKHASVTGRSENISGEGDQVQSEKSKETTEAVITEKSKEAAGAVTSEPSKEEEQTVTTDQKETQQIEQAAEASAIPSLTEYLSKRKCGGCGHGCTLLNPRCMRGARKQSTAESEYYALYGNAQQ